MYKVLIVEDEMLVRLGLKNSIKWSNFNMKIVGDADDGQKAWEIYQQEKPDLILTDLKMPVMEGMELISKVREHDRDTKIIILTCVEEFELAREAMSLGVSNYILKLTMDQEELSHVLYKVKDELDQSTRKAKHHLYHPENDQQYKENLIKDYLFYDRFSPSEFSQNIKDLGLNISPSYLVVCIMKIDHYERLETAFEDSHGQLIRMSLLNVLNELLQQYNRGEVFHDKHGKEYILLFSFSDIKSEQGIQAVLYDILGRINKVIKTYFNVSVSFGISSKQHQYDRLKQQYEESCQAIKKKFFSCEDIYFFPNDDRMETLPSNVQQDLQQLAKQCVVLTEKQKKVLESEIGYFISQPNFNKKHVKKMFTRWLYLTVMNLNASREDIISIPVLYTKKIDKAETIHECIRIYEEFINTITKTTRNQECRLSKEVRLAITYIEHHYFQDVTLRDIASEVNLSANYLTSLFKKEMDLSCIEYLIHFRIEKAKELLLTSHLKSYEVAYKVGFTDHSYFSRTFKKLTNRSPIAFRREGGSTSCG